MFTAFSWWGIICSMKIATLSSWSALVYDFMSLFILQSIACMHFSKSVSNVPQRNRSAHALEPPGAYWPGDVKTKKQWTALGGLFFFDILTFQGPFYFPYLTFLGWTFFFVNFWDRPAMNSCRAAKKKLLTKFSRVNPFFCSPNF